MTEPTPRPKVFVDVDGVIVAPDDEGLGADFIRDFRREQLRPGAIPTAKQSWSSRRLHIVPTAAQALQVIASSAHLVFVTAHPGWSVTYLLDRMALGRPVLIADWAGHFSNKAEAVAYWGQGVPWAWIDDDPGAAALATLEELGHDWRLIRPDPNVGLRGAHAFQALKLVGN